MKCTGLLFLFICSQILQNSLDTTSQCMRITIQSLLQNQPKSFLGHEIRFSLVAKSIIRSHPIDHSLFVCFMRTKLNGKYPKTSSNRRWLQWLHYLIFQMILVCSITSSLFTLLNLLNLNNLEVCSLVTVSPSDL